MVDHQNIHGEMWDRNDAELELVYHLSKRSEFNVTIV